MKRLGRGFLLALAAVVAGAIPAQAWADPPPAQHGSTEGHLLGPGAFGDIELLSVERLTDKPELVADVSVSPDGNWAFLANWGEPDCEGPEVGGQTSPDAGAWVVDIRNLDDPKTVGFIPSHQDTRPGEGMQVASVTTKQFSGEILVMNNEQCGKNGKGGISLWDVTNPTKPSKLSENFGDRGFSDSNETHSAFVWDVGDKAYAVMTDNVEQAGTDVDILDVTNPRRPRLIRELDVDAMFPQILQGGTGLTQVFLHDMVVKQIGGQWRLLLSYWDAGYVQLNVTDPANPTLIGDTSYQNPDPELFESLGVSLPSEGNGHQAEFTQGNQFFIGTDEDFAPFGATDFAIVGGAFAGPYASVPVPGAAPIEILDDEKLNGPAVYGGYGCPTSAPVPTPESIEGYEASLLDGEEKILVLQRGPSGDPSAPEAACFPGDKAHQAALAGWDAVLFVNHHPGEAAVPFCGSGAFVDLIVGVCTTHRAFHRLFDSAPTDPPFTYPDGPEIGTVSLAKIEATAAFDGWGYVHLYSNTPVNGKFPEIDTYAIDEAHDPAFAVGFGDLSVHEVATDTTDPTRAYLAYYAGGLRALQIEGNELVETGGYLDENGNNFWGVETFERDGRTIILGSDRDSGLWVFERTD